MLFETITENEDFIKIIQKNTHIICFVHSPWSGSSMSGLYRFKEIIRKFTGFTYAIIDNESAESFIYKWLEEQEPDMEKRNIKFIKKQNWIHGNGEMIGITKGKIMWFEPFLIKKSLDELESKGYFVK